MDVLVVWPTHEFHFNRAPLRAAIDGDDEGPQVFRRRGSAQVERTAKEVERGGRTAACRFVFSGGACVTREHQRLAVEPANAVEPDRGLVIDEVGLLPLPPGEVAKRGPLF